MRRSRRGGPDGRPPDSASDGRSRGAAVSSLSTRLVVTLLLATTLVTAASGVAVAHQFVGFDRAPLTATAGESAEVPINLHRTDRVTVAVNGPGGGFTAVVVDDGDGQATVLIDTAAADTPVRVESGALRRVTGDASLVPGEYELSLSVQRGLGDTTTLTLTEPTDGRQVSLPAVVGGLLGPLVPVAVLAVAARATRG